MRRSSIVLFALLVSLAAPAAPAVGAEVSEVADALANDGFYVERGASITESQAGDLVAEMTNAGEGFALVVLSEEPAAGATTFADNVQFALGRGLVLVIAPESLGYAGEGDVFTTAELERALDRAADTAGSDYDVAAAFVADLIGAPVGGTAQPVPVPTTVTAPSGSAPQSSGGGGSGWLWFLVIVGGIGFFLWWLNRRSKAKRQLAAEDRIAAARQLIQTQLDDIANDILEMEDEVRVADNDRAGRFYEQATETYNEATEALPNTSTPQALVDLSNKLDVAIWRLDCAEAILDDKPLPERPEPQRLEAPPPEAPSPQAPTPRAPVPRAPGVPGPGSYQRRPGRRSSYGGGVMDLLIVVGGTMLNQRRRRSAAGSRRGGGLGGLFGRRSTPSPPRAPAPPRSSRSGSPVPGPGRPGSPPKPTRTTRGTSGRVRSGRKRRRR